jgi:hypothetical protein
MASQEQEQRIGKRRPQNRERSATMPGDVQVKALVRGQELEPVVRGRLIAGRDHRVDLLAGLDQLPGERRHVVDVRIGPEEE